MNKIGRNDPCPCGSGKKYKQCCLQHAEIPSADKRTANSSIPSALQAAFEHHQAGRLNQAEALYRKILQIKPGHPDALHFLGVIALQHGRNEIAVEQISKAILANPADPICYINLGNAYKNQGKFDEAVENYQKALMCKPDLAEAHFNLGVTLQAQGKLDAAVENYHKTLALRPDYAKAYGNLGNTLRAQGKLNEAIESFQRALSLKPDNTISCSSLLFLHAYHASLDPQAYLSLARGWERACLHAHDRQLANNRIFRRPALAGRRLRVGYVSGDFCRHAVSYFIEQLFAHHDKARIELFAYSATVMRDLVTDRLQALADHWVHIAGIPDAAIRDRIEADSIDVLIDLSGHTRHNRLGIFARRAAPVQAHYLGYFASTGLTEMDYFIGDETLTPPETDYHFSEQVWRLPRVWVSYKTIANVPEQDWHPASDGSVWLGSFNNLNKLTPQTITLWARLLRALPEGRLLLKNKELADIGNRQRILNAMAGQGVLPDRIELQRDTDWAAYMAQYNRLDVALDPVGGHGGGTSTCDALWMGVPVIHALGDRATSRFTASMLNAIGHPEWVVNSEAEYVEKVVALARDVEQRKVLRSGQRERMAASSLCDAKSLALSLENAYFEMFDRWLENQRGRPFQAQGIS
jgi:protein O-GlcNAc transferase